jgi:hypothetical protein
MKINLDLDKLNLENYSMVSFGKGHPKPKKDKTKKSWKETSKKRKSWQ